MSSGNRNLFLLLLFFSTPVTAQTNLNELRAKRAAAFDSRAVQLLNRMVQAYATLDALEQQSEFYVTMTPLIPPPPSPDGKIPDNFKEQKLPHKMRLKYAEPNLVFMETEQMSETKETPQIFRWVSDGKLYWTYRGDNNWYTKDKAPGKLRDFARLSNFNTGSLEILMMLGINPFEKIKEVADTAQMEKEEVVRGVPALVVALKTSNERERTEARFYIGKDDLLLRRLTVETVPVIQKETGHQKLGDPLDELVEKMAPAPPATPTDTTASAIASLTKMTVRYDNIFSTTPAFNAETFHFAIPPNALLNELNGPDARRFQQVQDSQLAAILKGMGRSVPKGLKKARRIAF